MLVLAAMIGLLLAFDRSSGKGGGRATRRDQGVINAARCFAPDQNRNTILLLHVLVLTGQY